MEDASQEEICCAKKTKKSKGKTKRDIFRFAGEKPTAINLQHVTQMDVSGKRITFQFYGTAMYVDLENEAAALAAFDTIIDIWAGRIPL